MKIRKVDIHKIPTLAAIIHQSYSDVAKHFDRTPENCPNIHLITQPGGKK